MSKLTITLNSRKRNQSKLKSYHNVTRAPDTYTNTEPTAQGTLGPPQSNAVSTSIYKASDFGHGRFSLCAPYALGLQISRSCPELGSDEHSDSQRLSMLSTSNDSALVMSKVFPWISELLLRVRRTCATSSALWMCDLLSAKSPLVINPASIAILVCVKEGHMVLTRIPFL